MQTTSSGFNQLLAFMSVLASLFVGTAHAANIEIRVDATNEAQRFLQVHERITVPPGPLRLWFPRWLPGTHGPYGDVSRIAGLKVQAGKQPLNWQRDPADPFAFLIEVPTGASEIELDYQSLPVSASQPVHAGWTSKFINVQWHAVLLYPAGKPVAQISTQASLKLPAGWSHGSALRGKAARDGWIEFEPESLEALVDSPVFAGRHYRRIELDPPGTPQPVVMHVIADLPERLQASDAQIEAHKALVRQGVALFGVRPWRHYDLLLAIGDGLPRTALEHHESSENIYKTEYFKDWESASRLRDDVPHEFVHAWNGKARRPTDLWAVNFNTTTQNSLLWVYEGMTQYYGLVLAARSGIVSPELIRHRFGRYAAYFRETPGRRWRNLQDTTNDPALGPSDDRTWYDWQRGWDYYSESALLIWLDADTLIRQQSGNQRSLDDFARAFLAAGVDGQRGPRLYNFDDVVAMLNSVWPFDWKSFLRQRLDRTTDEVALEGLERAGWKLGYANKRSAMDLAALDPEKPALNLNASLGLSLAKDGKLMMVRWDGPAFRAGLSGEDQIIAVNMQSYSVDRMEAAITANVSGTKPVSLMVKRDDDYRVVPLDVRGGLRYPLLEPIEGRADGLTVILAPR
jgi:predicted metalloprotease with PDZ domain